MCYKNDKQKALESSLQEKIKDVPLFIQEYFVFIKSATTKINNWNTISKFLEWLHSQGVIQYRIEDLNHGDLKVVTDVHIVRYLNGLKAGIYCDTPMKLSTINTKKNILSGFWRHLVDNEYVTRNIVTKKVNNLFALEEEHEVTVPNEEELETFLNNIYNNKRDFNTLRNIAIVRLFMGSGIRCEELVGLDLKHVHLDAEHPYITVVRKGSQNAEKDVLINEGAANALDDYLKLRKMAKVDTDALFISERRKRISESAIRKIFKENSDGKIHPHMLRHYAGTMMHKNGVDLLIICEQLGHGDINTTRKWYVKTDVDERVKAINSI